MNTVIKRSIILVLLIAILLVTFAPYVQAGILSDAQTWINKGQGAHSEITPKAKEEVNKISGLLFGIGSLIAIIATIMLGIKYLLVSSSDSKAEVKKKALIVLVGVILLFGSVTIWRVLVDILSSAT